MQFGLLCSLYWRSQLQAFSRTVLLISSQKRQTKWSALHVYCRIIECPARHNICLVCFQYEYLPSSKPRRSQHQEDLSCAYDQCNRYMIRLLGSSWRLELLSSLKTACLFKMAFLSPCPIQKHNRQQTFLIIIAELHPRAKRARGRSPIAKEMW